MKAQLAHQVESETLDRVKAAMQAQTPAAPAAGATPPAAPTPTAPTPTAPAAMPPAKHKAPPRAPRKRDKPT